MTHRWHCRCGKLAGEVDAGAVVNRGICYCKDCQAFAYFLGAPARILDARGGTDIVQTSPQALTFTAGREQLACHAADAARTDALVLRLLQHRRRQYCAEL